MSEIDELRMRLEVLEAAISAPQPDADALRNHMVHAMGVAYRALGLAEGVGEFARLRLDGIEKRLDAMEAGAARRKGSRAPQGRARTGEAALDDARQHPSLPAASDGTETA